MENCQALAENRGSGDSLLELLQGISWLTYSPIAPAMSTNSRLWLEMLRFFSFISMKAGIAGYSHPLSLSRQGEDFQHPPPTDNEALISGIG